MLAKAVCSERACPALGGEAAPNQATRFYLEVGGVFIGAASAQRGASPLTTYCLREQARSHIGSSWISNSVTNDQNHDHSHKFCAILANRAAYCIELDSHKGFAA